MRSFVIIATKSRAQEVQALLGYLQRQTSPAAFTVVVGTEEADIVGIDAHPYIANGHGIALVSPRIGSTSQRNYGLEVLEQLGFLADKSDRFFCAFFDDDFRMADDWLARAKTRFAAHDIVGFTGKILADGVKKDGYTEEQAASFLKGELTPEEHWASGPQEMDVGSVYGCNMAFVDTVVRALRFDENAPLYAWLEDRDYTGAAKQFGRVIYYPGCQGVHMGTQSGGRSNGLRLGYSQIANPIYFFRKGTMNAEWTTKFVCRALASNLIHSVMNKNTIDYPGRLRGNILAVGDWLHGHLDPKRILTL